MMKERISGRGMLPEIREKLHQLKSPKAQLIPSADRRNIEEMLYLALEKVRHTCDASSLKTAITTTHHAETLLRRVWDGLEGGKA